jgi:hypothetical protein
MKLLKNYATLLILSILSTTISAQYAKKPTLMVVPSDNWCFNHGFIEEYDNQGKKIKSPDYRNAYLENSDILLVTSKINELIARRSDGKFELKNLESVLKTLQNNVAEDLVTTSKNGGEINESPVDKLKKIAKADVIIQITWTINQSGPKKSITFNIQGFDAYTDKQIAAASGTGNPSFSTELPILLEEAVISHIDNFNAMLNRHFEDMTTNGREISLEIKTFSTFDGDLESEYDGKELSEIIETWVNDNTVYHRFSTTDATENFMLFEQVRIPLFDANGKALDSRNWTQQLQKYLRDKYNITAKLSTSGLGKARLIIGDK